MSKMSALMTLPRSTVVVDRYGGAEFTVGELVPVVAQMLHTDTPKSLEDFCGRFKVKDEQPLLEGWDALAQAAHEVLVYVHPLTESSAKRLHALRDALDSVQ